MNAPVDVSFFARAAKPITSYRPYWAKRFGVAPFLPMRAILSLSLMLKVMLLKSGVPPCMTLTLSTEIMNLGIEGAKVGN
jgi:hypothetical protein